jgi:signal transduction histidine kinase
MSSEPIKVLLVEDNLGDARLLYEGMQEALPGQFQMTHVRRLSETLEYLWEDTCNVVLLDLGLPDSHGLDTLVLVRAQTPDVPIVVLTGFQDEEMGDRALKEGAQDYLVKGQVDSKLLARSMRYAIARKAAEQALIQQGVALAKTDELQHSRQRLIAVHELVRRDVAAQLKTTVQAKLHAATSRLRELLKAVDATPATSQVLTGVIDDLSQVCEQSLGALGRQLYPPTLSQGLVPTFQAFGEHLDSVPAIEIWLDEELVSQERVDHSLFPEQMGLAMFRIAEEALSNAIKHAKATKVTVRLDPLRQGWWRLRVQDDGKGFDLANVHHGLGIATMQDYARAMHGECVVQSTPGVGTEVSAALPLSRFYAEHPGTAEKGVN